MEPAETTASNLEGTARPDLPHEKPYVGLRPYDASEQDLFFGRDRDQQLLRNKIYSSRLTVLYAPSGVGKTSLLKTLTIPNLLSHGDVVIYVDQWPRDEPEIAVKAAIVQGAAAPSQLSVAELKETSLVDLIRHQLDVSPNRRWVIILDQFEQIFLRPNFRADSMDTLGRELGRLVRTNIDVHIVLSLREEFLARLQIFREHIVTLFGSTYRLEHLRGDGARQAIDGPGDAFEPPFKFDPDLLDALIRDLGITVASAGASIEAVESEGIDLPIMQIVCDHLWKESDKHRLSVVLYEQMGRRDGIITEYVNEITAGLSPFEKEEAAQVLDWLAPKSEIKMSYPVDILEKNTGISEERMVAILQHWEQQWVLRVREIGNVTTYELFHDAFIKVLRPWIDEQLDQKRERERKHEEEKQREKQRLEEQKQREEQLREERKQREEQQRETEQARRHARVLAGVAVIAIAACGAAIWAFQSAKAQAERAARALTIGVITDQGSSNPTIAAVALAELLEQGTADPFLLRPELWLDESQLYRATLIHAGRVVTAGFSPDGTTIVTASDDNTARLWDSRGRPLSELRGHTASLNYAAFSPDGQTLVTTSNDGTARLGDREGKHPVELKGHKSPVTYAAFSPDGQTIVTASEDG
jgi:hypothetical protein